MYRPCPVESRARLVFDHALNSRLAALDQQDAVLFVCNNEETVASLKNVESRFPQVRKIAVIVNPCVLEGTASTPNALGWENPALWRRYHMTDRWARIDFAFEVAGLMEQPGYLVMPAHDAVWGQDLLTRLISLSQRYTRSGLPAAVSPYTPYQHSAVPGAHIPPDVIALLNTAFGRDSLFRWKIRFDRVQAFWGKMGMIPFALCAAVRESCDRTIWEDDLEIDRVIRELGYGVRCLWVGDARLYRQAPPVFDREDVRKVIERTLHYSLHIPDERVGGSSLNQPLDVFGRLRGLFDHSFAHQNALAEALIAECCGEITGRLAQFGASWVDWGAYRYVARVGHPAVEVWKLQSGHSK